ncbi:unnamed protein product, partial [Meganyctiphanes norvegica]
VTSAYHPQCNGLDERTNQTLKTRLGKLSNEHQDNWPEFLPHVAYSMRTQKQKATKHTPYFLLFARHPRSFLEMDPVDMEVVVPEMEESGIEEKINLMITQSEKIREISKKKV